MKISSLDLQGSLSKQPSRAELDEYTKILDNPDLLGRLFRLFVHQNTRKGLWKDLFNQYLDKNSYQSKSWLSDRRTNLERTLFESDTVTWTKFLEAMVILEPAFDTLEVEVFTDLNDGKVSSLRIRPTTLIHNEAMVQPIPKGELLIPHDFHRSPLEPLPLKVVRDTISTIGTSEEFRRIVRENLKPYTHTSKLSSTVSSLYVSVLKADMSWKRMITTVFAVGAGSLMVRIKGVKRGKRYVTIVEVKR